MRQTDDLISRSAAIAEIEDYIEEYSGVDMETGLHNPKWCAMVEAKDVLVKLPAAQTCGWISVKDKMPQSGEHVLVCCEIHPLNPNGMSKKHYICDGYYAAKHSIADGCRDSDYYDAYDYDEEEDEYYLKEGWYEVIKNWDEYSSVVIEDFVKYWMPLPELPEEVATDD